MKILVTLPMGYVWDTFFTPDVVEKLESMGEIVWNESKEQFSTGELRERLTDVDICITGWGTKCLDIEVLETAEKLKLVAHTAGSVAGLVSDYLYEKGIKVISGNWVFAESVAESVIGYIICSLRELTYYNNEVKQGRWRGVNFFNEGILDQSVGLVGFGAVAKYLVKFLKPFRCKIKVYDPYADDKVFIEHGVERGTLEEIFSTCKIISLHVPKTPDTYHMIDKRLLSMIKDGSLLVNTARGAVIDEEALVEELEKGRFKAALDVYEVEPLPLDSKLRTLINVLTIPHMGGPTIDRRRATTLELLKDIEGYLRGEELKFNISKAYAQAMTK
jgi:phosphoglycerate dehydrogenase-like enzyme